MAVAQMIYIIQVWYLHSLDQDQRLARNVTQSRKQINCEENSGAGFYARYRVEVVKSQRDTQVEKEFFKKCHFKPILGKIFTCSLSKCLHHHDLTFARSVVTKSAFASDGVCFAAKTWGKCFAPVSFSKSWRTVAFSQCCKLSDCGVDFDNACPQK